VVRLTILAALALAALAMPASPDTSGRDPLITIGLWNFDKGDARDSSDGGANGVVHDVAFKDGCAILNGKSWIDLSIRAATLRRGYRTLDIEIRAQFDRPESYYGTIFSHPLFNIAVHALTSTKGRPCFNFAGVVSVLAPDEGGDGRWGKGRPLSDETETEFFYWGWIGNGAIVIPAKTWVTIRTVYDGKAVLQYLDGKLVATHKIKNPGARIAIPTAVADEHAVIGKQRVEIGAETAVAGTIDYVRVRGTR